MSGLAGFCSHVGSIPLVRFASPFSCDIIPLAPICLGCGYNSCIHRLHVRMYAYKQTYTHKHTRACKCRKDKHIFTWMLSDHPHTRLCDARNPKKNLSVGGEFPLRSTSPTVDCCSESRASADCLGCLRHYGVPCCHHVSFLLACVYVNAYVWRADVHIMSYGVATFSQ